MHPTRIHTLSTHTYGRRRTSKHLVLGVRRQEQPDRTEPMHTQKDVDLPLRVLELVRDPYPGI